MHASTRQGVLFLARPCRTANECPAPCLPFRAQWQHTPPCISRHAPLCTAATPVAPGAVVAGLGCRAGLTANHKHLAHLVEASTYSADLTASHKQARCRKVARGQASPLRLLLPFCLAAARLASAMWPAASILGARTAALRLLADSPAAAPCRDMQAALLVYDVTSRASFEALPAWLEEARKGGAGSMVGTAAACLAHGMCGARRGWWHNACQGMLPALRKGVSVCACAARQHGMQRCCAAGPTQLTRCLPHHCHCCHTPAATQAAAAAASAGAGGGCHQVRPARQAGGCQRGP
jgi:hypothetical protein